MKHWTEEQEKKYQERKQWFIDRIGKRVFREETSCQCETCKKARTIGAPYKRNSSSLFIKDINTVIDCGEDIASSLNRENIKKVENLLITHWHPDHTFGLRAIIEANFNFRTGKPNQVINLYIPKRVYIMLKEKYPSIDYFIYGQKTAKLHLIEDNQ